MLKNICRTFAKQHQSFLNLRYTATRYRYKFNQFNLLNYSYYRYYSVLIETNQNPLNNINTIMSNDDNKKLFESIGLKQKIKNKHTIISLKECIHEAKVENGCDASIGNLIYEIATTKKMDNDNAKKNRTKLLSYVVTKKIKSKEQLNAAIHFVSNNATFNDNELDKACGVGVVVTEKEIINVVDKTINKYKSQLATKGYVK